MSMQISEPSRAFHVPSRRAAGPPPSPLTKALRGLSVGQSIHVRGADINRVRWVAHGWARHNGQKVTTRKTTKGVRIWRTA